MLKDLVPQFADAVKEFPALVTDNYELKEGLYIRLSLKEPFTKIDDRDYLVINKNEEIPMAKSTLYRWFKNRDSYSGVLNDNTNKAVDTSKKVILSTNFLTFFSKKETVFGEGGKYSTNDINKHFFKSLKTVFLKTEEKLFEVYPIEKTRKKDEREQKKLNREYYFQEHYSDLIDYLRSSERALNQKLVIEYWEKYFSPFIEAAKELAANYKVSNYIKVFFDADESEYRKEYEAYVLPRIFNVNDFNKLVDGEIVGLPMNDVNMNKKKPFLELKTLKTKVPTRVTIDEALHIKNLYQSLQKQGKFKELKLSFHELFGPATRNEKSRDVARGAYYIALDNGGIQHYENVPFQPRVNWRLDVDNVLEVQEKKGDIWLVKAYQGIEGKGQLRKEISRLFFGASLPNNILDTDVPKVKENVLTTEMVSIYVMVRQALFDFLVKDTEETIRPFLKKHSLQLIENQLLKTVEGMAFRKMADAFQLRLALLINSQEREGSELSDRIKEIYGLLQSKLSKRGELITCESDEEFFFLAGQIGYYLLAQSEASQKTYGVAEPILKARNPKVLKNKLADLFDTYSHAISYEYVAFKGALAMLQGYETKAKLEGTNKSLLLAGLLANNLFFQKQDRENTEEVENG